ncbi:hypothetical protein STEG23_027218, partial [Scotinomys teguina]
MRIRVLQHLRRLKPSSLSLWATLYCASEFASGLTLDFSVPCGAVMPGDTGNLPDKDCVSRGILILDDHSTMWNYRKLSSYDSSVMFNYIDSRNYFSNITFILKQLKCPSNPCLLIEDVKTALEPGLQSCLQSSTVILNMVSDVQHR